MGAKSSTVSTTRSVLNSLNFEVKEITLLAEGDLVCLHWSASFKHKQTDKRLQVTGTSVACIKDGRFVKAWQNWDQASLAAQLPHV